MNGKIALVTGSTKGIGKAIALGLARAGATAIINGSTAEAGIVLEKEMKEDGLNVLFIQADVSDFSACAALAARIKESFGKIDILVNNAGITRDKTLKNMTADEWNSVVSLNLGSLFNVTRNCIGLVPDHGRIINVGAVAGIAGNFGQTNYAAAKAGIIGFSKSLAKELGKRKITVNVVAPGLIQSEMTGKIPAEVMAGMLQLVALREAGRVEDVMAAVRFLASKEAGYITGLTGGFRPDCRQKDISYAGTCQNLFYRTVSNAAHRPAVQKAAPRYRGDCPDVPSCFLRPGRNAIRAGNTRRYF